MASTGSWQNVGQNIRYLRKSHQLTLKQLASGCGLSPNAISLIERGKVAPTVATLCKIAYALGVPVSHFFQQVCPTKVILTRAQGGLAGQQAEQALRVSACDIVPEGHLSEPDMGDPVEEGEASTADYAYQSGICICGQIEYEADGKVYRLGPGDNISFDRNALYRWRNPGNTTAIAIIVLPPHPQQNTANPIEPTKKLESSS